MSFAHSFVATVTLTKTVILQCEAWCTREDTFALALFLVKTRFDWFLLFGHMRLTHGCMQGRMHFKHDGVLMFHSIRFAVLPHGCCDEAQHTCHLMSCFYLLPEDAGLRTVSRSLAHGTSCCRMGGFESFLFLVPLQVVSARSPAPPVVPSRLCTCSGTTK